MTIKEQLDALKEKIKAKIKPESTPEDLEEYQGMLNSLDDIEKQHNEVLGVNAKYKDTIVNMVLNQGDDKTPGNPSDDGRNPKSMDELLAEFQAKQDKEQGGK